MRPGIDNEAWDNDDLHVPATDDPWFTETAWYSFWTSGGAFAVHIYLRFRPNLGIADSSVYAWESGSSVPWETAYWKQVPVEMRTDPTVAGTAARYHLALGAPADAQAIIEQALEREWSASLVALYQGAVDLSFLNTANWIAQRRATGGTRIDRLIRRRRRRRMILGAPARRHISATTA